MQALKGLALLRSGKTADSETLMEEIRGAQPADDPTLQAMTICYREMQKRKASTTVFFYLFSYLLTYPVSFDVPLYKRITAKVTSTFLNLFVGLPLIVNLCLVNEIVQRKWSVPCYHPV